MTNNADILYPCDKCGTDIGDQEYVEDPNTGLLFCLDCIAYLESTDYDPDEPPDQAT